MVPDDELFYARGVAGRESGFSLLVGGMSIQRGGVEGLLGASGSGKSSLLEAMFGLAPGCASWRGERRWAGGAWPERGTAAHRGLLQDTVCVLPQDARAALDPLRPVGAQIIAAVGAKVRARRPDIVTAFDRLGVADGASLLDRTPHGISGGQAQSVLLAIALLRQPALLIADEPSTGLDAARIDDLIGGLGRLRDGGAALCLATHDREILARLGARCWSIRSGELRREVGEVGSWPKRLAWSNSPDPETLLDARSIGVRRGGSWILETASITLGRGESVALVGPSGAGKTTLARVLSGQLAPSRGEVWRAAPRVAQLVPQDAYGSLTPERSGRSLVAETSVPGFDLAATAAAIGLDAPTLRRSTAELSGGERRRVALLRALSVRPAVLLLDEPTAELDRHTAIEVVAMLLECQRHLQLATLWITHDRSLAEAVAERVVTIDRGRTC